jgi:predicted esterase
MTLAALLLGIAAAITLLPMESPAQVGALRRLQDKANQADRLDSLRIAAFREAIRQHAMTLKPQDLAKDPFASRPLSPLKSPPGKEKLISKPQVGKVEQKKPAAVAAKSKASPTSKELAKATQRDTKPAKPLFDPYPRGPEPSVPRTPPGYHPHVAVLAPGRLDWTFVTSSSSLDPAPSQRTAGYVSARQSYELYVPPGYDARRAYPLIVYIPAAMQSEGWQHFQAICRQHQVVFAGVHGAGNAVRMTARARVVLDVLDDVRRRFRIDPDRTYLSGTSGGGNAAAHIVFALPELFGGFMPICGTWSLRPEPMLRQRVSERLSVAVLTGSHDFNGNEMALEFYPILREHRARARLWVYPGMGHAVPNHAQLEGVFLWLEAGLPMRRLSSAVFPASRLVGPVTPDSWSTAALLEAGERLQMENGLASGLFLLQGVSDRWKGLPAADLAEQLLNEFDALSPVPWKEIYRAEKLQYARLEARAYDQGFNPGPPPGYPVPWSNRIQIGVELWTNVLNLAPPGSPVAREAEARLNAYRKMPGA